MHIYISLKMWKISKFIILSNFWHFMTFWSKKNLWLILPKIDQYSKTSVEEMSISWKAVQKVSRSAGRRIRESESDSDPIRLGFGFGLDWAAFSDSDLDSDLSRFLGFGFGSDWRTFFGFGFGSDWCLVLRIRIRIGLIRLVGFGLNPTIRNVANTTQKWCLDDSKYQNFLGGWPPNPHFLTSVCPLDIFSGTSIENLAQKQWLAVSKETNWVVGSRSFLVRRTRELNRAEHFFKKNHILSEYTIDATSVHF